MTLPLYVALAAVIAATVIFGVPVNPCAFVASVAVSALPVKSPVTSPTTSPVKLPLKVVAVTTPVIFAPPVPVIYFPLISKLPPSCGVASPKIFVVIPVREAYG